MRRPLRIAAAVALLLALASCVRSVPVRAFFLDGRLAFAAAGLPGGEPRCFSEFFIADESGRSAWELAGPEEPGGAGCRDFPVVYGRAPAGARTVAPAAALVPGRVYAIGGWAGDPLEGAFRYLEQGAARRIENVDPRASEVAQALARRRELQDALPFDGAGPVPQSVR